MIRIELAENGSVQVVLSAKQGRRLAASDVVTAMPSSFDPRLWDVAARGKVGVARVGDVEVWVALDTRDGPVPAIAQALWRQTERALRNGLVQGYRTVDESSYVLRGRLRESDQLRRHYAQIIPMEIWHDDFTIDVAENRILLAAITRMLTVPAWMRCPAAGSPSCGSGWPMCDHPGPRSAAASLAAHPAQPAVPHRAAPC